MLLGCLFLLLPFLFVASSLRQDLFHVDEFNI
jgi:hypothetical protein